MNKRKKHTIYARQFNTMVTAFFFLYEESNSSFIAASRCLRSSRRPSKLKYNFLPCSFLLFNLSFLPCYSLCLIVSYMLLFIYPPLFPVQSQLARRFKRNVLCFCVDYFFFVVYFDFILCCILIVFGWRPGTALKSLLNNTWG